MNILFEERKIRLPDFLIVGAAKSGTTSLYFYLKEHPQIYMPDNKEPWFFSFMDNPTDFDSPDPLNGIISNLDEYVKLFEGADYNQIIGEASPSYLYTNETTINNIKKTYGEHYKDLKIIMVLRNPADRAFSQYMQFKENFQEPLSFKKAIRQETINERLKNNWNFFYDYIGFGMYFRQVKSYIEVFDNIKIILFDDLKNNTDGTVRDLLKFLEVDENILPKNTQKKYNVSRVLRKNFFAPLYKFYLFSDNKLKKKLAESLPDNTKKKIDEFIKKLFLKRKRLSSNEKEKLMSLYEKDYKKVHELINSISNNNTI